MNILIVRLGALGDIVHTIPAVAALRAAMPAAQIDWLVEAKHRAMVDLVEGVDRVIALEGRSIAAWVDALRRVRTLAYDAALDFQGLMKSAVLARASGEVHGTGVLSGQPVQPARQRARTDAVAREQREHERDIRCGQGHVPGPPCAYSTGERRALGAGRLRYGQRSRVR